MNQYKSNTTNAPEKWGVYLHIPYCRSRCAYCSFVSGCDFSDMNDYVTALINEIRARGGDEADTVYIGGGTPSTLARGMVTRIMSAVRKSFKLVENSEISIECNPDSATREFFDECAAAGVNRVSIGLQSASNDLLKAVLRPHVYEQFLTSVKAARAAGIDNINADLMLGLPSQTMDDVMDSVGKVVELKLPHLSVYGLSVEEGTPLKASGYKPDEDLCADMYERVTESLRGYGYNRYEVSNFALDGFECRHNLKYWRRVPYIGLGLAAHSFDGKTRRVNTSDKTAYLRGDIESERVDLTKSDEIEEIIMLSLRTAAGLDHKLLRRNYGYDLLESKAHEIERLAKLGLIEADERTLKLTDKAFYVMNFVIVSLL